MSCDIEGIKQLHECIKAKGLSFNETELNSLLMDSINNESVLKVSCGELEMIFMPTTDFEDGDACWIDTFFGIRGVGTFKLVRDGYKDIPGLCDGDRIYFNYTQDFFSESH